MLTVDPPAEELLATLPTELVNAGYTQTRDSVENRDDRQIRWFDFDIPGATSRFGELSIAVVDDPNRDILPYEVNFDLEPNGADFMDGGWIPGLPFLDAGTPESSSFSTFALSSRTTLDMTSRYNLPMPIEQAREQFLAALEGTPYTADPTETWPRTAGSTSPPRATTRSPCS